MHGRLRKAAKTGGAEEANAAKALKLRSLQSQLLDNHQACVYTDEAIELSSSLIEINPEFYTVWNYRKLAVEHKLSISDEHAPDDDALNSIFNRELRAVEAALKQNFKSYGAWHHRRWILGKIHPRSCILASEMRILDQFHKFDPRNFHAWNHRRFVDSLNNLDSGIQELHFTTAMINANFSNYSAWHNRSVILSRLMENKADGFFPKHNVLASEFDLVHQALFTDPDDQSGWFYYLWLLQQTIKSKDSVVLLSSWPSNGASLDFPVNSGSDFDWLADSISFPLVLCFSHVVEGVNLKTVLINCSFSTPDNNDIIWTPLSSVCGSASLSWGCVLSFPKHSAATHLVEVTVGFCKGIVSVSGSEYNGSSLISFTLHVEPKSGVIEEGDDGVGLFRWSDEPFDSYKMLGRVPNGQPYFDRVSECGDGIVGDFDVSSLTSCEDTVANEISLFRDLLSEVNSKFGKVSMARLLVAFDMIRMVKGNSSCLSEESRHSEEAIKLFGELVEIDYSHAGYYRDERSVVVVQDVALMGVAGRSNWLRLNDLSLSRVGPTERLLWVKVLDLCHNEIRSIEGLEALQLLRCLNLSYNKIGSFSSLGPLVFLKSLRVLDISYNEIGSHPVDSTRFLCSSLRSHGIEFYPGEGGYDFGEASAVFKVLNLKQLDIEGNPISSPKLKLFLAHLLPNLEWIDGAIVH